MARFNHSLGQRACGCERRGVEWIMVSSGAVMFGLSGCVVLRHRMDTTIVLARRPINAAVVESVVLRCDESVRGESVCGKACCVLAKPHPCRHGSRSTREVWGELWHVQSGCGVLCPVASRRVSAFNQARAGTVPDQRRRLGMNSGSMRLDSVCRGESRSCVASRGMLRLGM